MLPRSGMCCEGGTAKYLQDIVPGLLRRGHEFTVYTTGLNSERHKNYSKVHHTIIPGGHLSIDERLETAKNHVMHAINQDFDILHLHYPSTTFFISDIHNAGKKVVVTHHGSQFIRYHTDDARARQLYCEYKLMLKSADAVVVHSPILYESYRSEGISNIFFVPMGVKIPNKPVSISEKFHLKPNNYILFAGKLRKEKGLDIIIDAYNCLKTSMPLVIIGNDSFEPEYALEERRIAAKNKNILFLGEQLCEQRNELFANAYCYVNPLRIQGLPLTVLEAAAFGRGIINSDNSNHHGIIAECTNKFQDGDVKSLAEAMNLFLSSPKYVSALGEKARLYARTNHSISNVINIYDTIYRSV